MLVHDINNIRVAPNFLLREFECRDGSHQVVLHRELLEQLQALRDALSQLIISNLTDVLNSNGGLSGTLILNVSASFSRMPACFV